MGLAYQVFWHMPVLDAVSFNIMGLVGLAYQKFQSLALPPLVHVIGMVGFEWTKNISPPSQSQKPKPILKVQRFQHHRAWKSSAASPWRRIWMTLIKIFDRLQMCVLERERERDLNNFVFGSLIFCLKLNKLGL